MKYSLISPFIEQMFPSYALVASLPTTVTSILPILLTEWITKLNENKGIKLAPCETATAQHLRVQLLQLELELRDCGVPVDGRRHVLSEGQHERPVVCMASDFLDFIHCATQ